MAEVRLPFTSTGRKYGYVTWGKSHDAAMRELLGQRDRVVVRVGEKPEAEKYVDWRHRRISVGYAATRSLPEDVQEVQLRAEGGRLAVEFHKGN